MDWPLFSCLSFKCRLHRESFVRCCLVEQLLESCDLICPLHIRWTIQTTSHSEYLSICPYPQHKLAIYINKSPQRRESFIQLQTADPKLLPIQDVR